VFNHEQIVRASGLWPVTKLKRTRSLDGFVDSQKFGMTGSSVASNSSQFVTETKTTGSPRSRDAAYCQSLLDFASGYRLLVALVQVVDVAHSTERKDDFVEGIFKLARGSHASQYPEVSSSRAR
jgi:hypothetical protein